MKNNKKGTIWTTLIIFALVGIAIIVGAFFMYKDAEKFKENAIKTTATIIDVIKTTDSDGETEYNIKYKYVVDGVEYESIKTKSNIRHKGENEIVYYNRLNPEDMRFSTSNYSIFMFFMGLIFLVPISINITSSINTMIKKNTLTKDGEMIMAPLSYVDVNTAISVNNKNPYYIVCTYMDAVTGEERIFKSKNLYFDPNTIIEEKNIKAFPIYINKNNPKKYYFSLDELKRK